MKNYDLDNKALILGSQDILDLLSALEYATLVLEKDLKPIISVMKITNENLEKNIENFDQALAEKSIEVLEHIDLEYVQDEIITQVVKNITGRLKGMGNIGILAKQMTSDVDILKNNQKSLKSVLSNYETKIGHAKTFSFIYSVNLVFWAFFTGALLSPIVLMLVGYFSN